MGRPADEAAIACTRWLEHLLSQLPLVRAGGDAEAVHQLRVASARLRVWLTLGGLRVLHDDLRWLRRQAAGARDLDVCLALAPPPALAERLRRRLPKARGALIRALDAPRVNGAIEALRLLEPLPRSDAASRVRLIARQVLRRGSRAEQRPRDVPALHELRRAVRRLRFALEWLGQRPRAVVALQTALGQVGDHAVALRVLERAPAGDRAAAAYRRRLQRELQRRARRARAAWLATRPAVERLAR
jgi:CHAD domain-containing protein